MEEIIRTPMDPSASGGAVANSPPKPTIPPIRQRIRGPFTRYPVVNGPVSKLALKPTVPTRPLVRQKIVGPVHPAVNERISRPTLNPVSSIEAELAEVEKRLGKVPFNQQPRCGLHLFNVRFRGRHAMAASQLRGEEFSGGSSPSARRTADEA